MTCMEAGTIRTGEIIIGNYVASYYFYTTVCIAIYLITGT